MIQRLIGITGLAGAGKDTLANAIVSEFAGIKYSWALPLKLALNAMFGWTMEMWDDRVWKETEIPWLGKSPRQLAQTMGTEWGRELVHPELWVMLGMRQYEAHAALSNSPFIIADTRFDNEARAIHRNGGIVVKVIRDDAAPIFAHKSEKGVSPDLIDYTLGNNGTVDDFVNLSLALFDIWSTQRA